MAQVEKLLISDRREGRHVAVLQGARWHRQNAAGNRIRTKTSRSVSSGILDQWKDQGYADLLLARLVKRLSAQQTSDSLDNARDIKALEKRAKWALNWFKIKGNTQWLLIYNNIDKDAWPDISEDSYDIEEFFPGADHGSIMVTTRSRSLQDLGDFVHVKTMSTKEAFKILTKCVHLRTLKDDANNWGRVSTTVSYNTQRCTNSVQ